MFGQGVEIGDVADLLDVQPDRTVNTDRHADELARVAQRETRAVGEHGLAVRRPALARAVEGERSGRCSCERCQNQADERVGGEVARTVGRAAEAGEPDALVVVEQADQRRCDLRIHRRGPPDGAASSEIHVRDATGAPPGRAGRPPPRTPAARIRISPSGGRG